VIGWYVQAGTPLHVLKELGIWLPVEMVRRCAHLAADHLATYVDRVSGLRLADADEAATLRLWATEMMTTFASEAVDISWSGRRNSNSRPPARYAGTRIATYRIAALILSSIPAPGHNSFSDSLLNGVSTVFKCPCRS